MGLFTPKARGTNSGRYGLRTDGASIACHQREPGEPTGAQPGSLMLALSGVLHAGLARGALWVMLLGPGPTSNMQLQSWILHGSVPMLQVWLRQTCSKEL